MGEGGEGGVGGAGYHDDRLAVRNRHHSKIGFGADKPMQTVRCEDDALMKVSSSCTRLCRGCR